MRYTVTRMPYKAARIANAFLSLAPAGSLTNMQLQKLVYIAHGYHLAITGKPLIEEPVSAWQWGPVIIPLYEALKHYGSGKVTKRLPTGPQPLDPSAALTVHRVWKGYGRFSGFRLSEITHKPGSPWSQTWETDHYGEIPEQVIIDHYKRLLHERKSAS